ncbi:MAG: hypothetical protein NDI81_20410 [Desulfobacula sp.]|nr:hypothetical protein [Desulfobacula sp.]MDA8135602.1 hypothetical protein [Desulfobacteraceae bacterium]
MNLPPGTQAPHGGVRLTMASKKGDTAMSDILSGFMNIWEVEPHFK